eukprot:490940-Prymnesium_polylepis.1
MHATCWPPGKTGGCLRAQRSATRPVCDLDHCDPGAPAPFAQHVLFLAVLQRDATLGEASRNAATDSAMRPTSCSRCSSTRSNTPTRGAARAAKAMAAGGARDQPQTLQATSCHPAAHAPFSSKHVFRASFEWSYCLSMPLADVDEESSEHSPCCLLPSERRCGWGPSVAGTLHRCVFASARAGAAPPPRPGQRRGAIFRCTGIAGLEAGNCASFCERGVL